MALAIDEGRALTGATKEVVDELRSKGGYQGVPVPLAALETRAGETVAADQINPKTIRPVIDRLFPASVASRLGVQSINITSGELEFPVATAGAVFGWQTTELANVGTASEYQTSERSLNPDQTGGAQMIISRKALKQAGEGLESAIRRDLNAVIATELDRVVVNGSGAAGQPLGIIPGAATYGIASTAVGAAATWAAFRAQVVAFMQANAITSASQVNLGFGPAIWAELDDALITGTAVSEWDRLTKHIASPAISNVIPDETAILTATVQGIAPGYLGIYGGVAANEVGMVARLHGLRKAFCVYWAEKGATTHQIAAMAGHMTLGEVERYTRAADRLKWLSFWWRDNETGHASPRTGHASPTG